MPSSRVSRRALLGLADSPPERSTASITGHCLAHGDIACESCAEVCDHGAILFTRARMVKRPFVVADRCTGCGACVEVCPASAIVLPLEAADERA